MQDEKVMGVYGPLAALPGATFWDYLFHGLSYIREYGRSWPRGWRVIEKDKTGVMGFTNALIRKDLWDAHHFDERFAGGGEDGEWARHWFARGFHPIKAIGFAVRHSHNLSLEQWRKQRLYWAGLGAPTPFAYLQYRNDGAHKPR